MFEKQQGAQSFPIISTETPRPSLQPAALLALWDGFGSNQERRAWGEALSREDRALLVNALGSRIMEHAKAWPIRA
jgi:hypothetical protein